MEYFGIFSFNFIVAATTIWLIVWVKIVCQLNMVERMDQSITKNPWNSFYRATNYLLEA